MDPQESLQNLMRRLRQRLREQPVEKGRSDPIARSPASSFPSPLPSGSLTDLVPGEVHHCAAGSWFQVCRTAADLHGDVTDLVACYTHLFQLPHLRGEFAVLQETTPEKVLFLDIETTGLMSTPLFLIGLGSLIEGDLVTTQLLARDYTEEAAVLAEFQEWLTRYEVLVTFNGKSFDVRFIGDRLIFHRFPSTIPHSHIDLLPLARRRWRGHFENCRLQTLETRVCGRTRTGDIPSAEIPQAYRDFVRTSDVSLMQPILYHNAMDLVTMVELLVMLVGK